jgi:acetyl esterase/lipase
LEAQSVGRLPRLLASAGLALILIPWTAFAAEPVPYQLVEDRVYGHKDGLALTLDVVTPRQGAKGVGVILVSSGSWRSSKSAIASENQRRLEKEHWTQGLLRGGYTLFVARHGSAPRYRVPEMVEDIRRCVRFVRLHADEFQVDPNHLGITSGSSGGHLALMVATTGDDGRPDARDPVERVSSRVQAVVAWFPPTDLINWGSENGYQQIEKSRPGLFAEMFGTVKNLEEQLKSVSPLYFVSTDDPPLLLIHGDRDPVVPLQQSEVLRARYEAVGVPVKLIVHPGGRHTYWPGILDDYPAVWAWFDKYLRPTAAVGADREK